MILTVLCGKRYAGYPFCTDVSRANFNIGVRRPGQLGNHPKLAQQAAAQIPNARFTIIPDVSHIPHIEQPEVFYQTLLGFLNTIQ